MTGRVRSEGFIGVGEWVEVDNRYTTTKGLGTEVKSRGETRRLNK